MDFHFVEAFETISAAVPAERECIVFRDRRLTYTQVAERSRRLANYLIGRGVRVHRERSELQGHESGQDHVALYLYNGNEYLEGMLGAFASRSAPLNVNYRYVEEELLYLFANSQAKVLIYHAEFAPNVASIRKKLPNLGILIQVQDESGNALLPGAVDYEEALAGASSELPDLAYSPDDLYILYTGGTTGMPKGVLWRSADIFMGAMGGRRMDGSERTSLEEIRDDAANGPGIKTLVGPPFMHGAAQWATFINFSMGSTIVLPDEVRRFDAENVLEVIEREKVKTLTIVGDAFARPLADAMRQNRHDVSSLLMIGSGGAALSTTYKEYFLEKIPHLTVLDAIGSSETGAQASNPSNRSSGVSTGDFKPGPGAGVVSEDLTRVLEPGDPEVGWFSQSGRVPLGYFGDAAKTASTFPVIEGVRYSVPGDRAHYRDDGGIEVLGRDSVTINSGGEKIFAEEVEAALKHHPDIYDTVVAGRPSERWGSEVVAIVALCEGATATESELLAEASKHIARYKLPKAFVFRDTIARSPSGKADYRWARAQADSGR